MFNVNTNDIRTPGVDYRRINLTIKLLNLIFKILMISSISQNKTAWQISKIAMTFMKHAMLTFSFTSRH